MTRRWLTLTLCSTLAISMTMPLRAAKETAQGSRPVVLRSANVPLASLSRAAAEAAALVPEVRDVAFEVPNFGLDRRAVESVFAGPDAALQDFFGPETTNILTSFDGSDNWDNQAVIGGRVAPPDTNGDVGPTRYLQMINLITTVFNKSGGILAGPFPSNAFWSGFGGVCQSTNRGDPVVLYDESRDRWLVSQFAFNTNFFGTPSTPFVQCIAISQTGDPSGAYNRYAFDLTGFGFNDYPKHGITSDSITLMANIFTAGSFSWGGTLIAAIDKDAMYGGQTATLVAFNLGTGEFGFVAGDLDDSAGTAGFVPALFATAMSRSSLFDIWQIDVDWANPASASRSRVAGIPISPFDADFCSASREACVPQPSPGPALETLSDRLMHRLQIRDFGSYKSMVAAHAVDVGGGRAGIRWYEMRNSGAGWSLHQEGTYGPADGLHRWMPSIAMNAAGDIGIGFMVSSTGTYPSTAVTGQTAAASGTGTMNADESFCQVGTGVQTGTARAGDYSATSVDPTSDTFWHTNEYVFGGGNFVWNTNVCEFDLTGVASACGDGVCDPDESECSCAVDCGAPPSTEVGLCADGVDNDCDTLADCADSDCSGDPACFVDPCGDGICDPAIGETCDTCAADCPSGDPVAPGCGNGYCEPGRGEDCLSCPSDCRGKQSGKPDNRYCCGDGDGENPVSCADARCTSGGFQCSDTLPGGFCCGDAVCDGGDECVACGVDCSGDPICEGPPPVDCSVYTDKRSCNAQSSCRWDNRNNVCIPN